MFASIGVRNLASTLAAVVLLAGAPALAQQPDINVQRFEASPHEGDMMAIRTATQPTSDGPSGGLFLTYTKDPLRLVDNRFDPVQTFQLVDNMLTADLFAAWSFWRSLSVGLNVPVALYSKGASGFQGAAPADATGLGDLRLSLRYLIVPRAAEGFGLGIEALVGFPTATSGTWAGDANVTFTPRVIADWRIADFLLAANVGYRVKEGQELATYDAGGEVLLGLGAEYRLFDDRLGILGELLSSTNQEDFFGRSGTTLEGQIGLNYCIAGVSRVYAAGGGGMLDGIGDPSLRVTAGVRIESCGLPPEPPKDRDGDGVVDGDDACPDVPGIETRDPATNGCPADKDGDGIYDKDDACVDVPGVKSDDPKKNGCPSDRDQDTIIDAEDACPDVPGPRSDVKELNGCPPPKVTKEKIEILQRIEFEVDRDILLAASERILDEVARVILENPEIKIVTIEGHTDNTAAADYNMKLSEKRAKAVKAYLIKKGIEGKRLKTVGYGLTRPIAGNDTEEGKQKNRRVEFKVQWEEK